MHNDRNRSKRAYLEEKFGLWRLFEICVKFRLSVFKNHLYCVSIMPMGHHVWFEIASLCSFTTRPAKGHQPPKKYRQTRLFQAGLRLFFLHQRGNRRCRKQGARNYSSVASTAHTEPEPTIN